MATLMMDPVFQFINHVNDFSTIKKQVRRSKDERIMKVYKDLEMSYNFMDGLFKFVETKVEFLIKDTPSNRKIDDESEIVLTLEQLENALKKFHHKLEPPPIEEEWSLATYYSWKNLSTYYTEVFQNLRWEILIHDGQLSTLTGNTFSGSDGYVAALDASVA